MADLLARVRRLIRRPAKSVLRTVTAASQTLQAYVEGRRSRTYDFTLSDALVHFVERTRRLPELEPVGGDPYPIYEIEGRRFAWPAELPTSGLPWLFTEVYAAPRRNPSSYDHPEAPLQGRPWVLDAGAGEGFFTRWSVEAGARRTIAVEPLQVLQGPLRWAFSQEVENGRVDIIRAAIGARTGETSIDLAPEDPSEAMIGRGASECRYGRSMISWSNSGSGPVGSSRWTSRVPRWTP